MADLNADFNARSQNHGMNNCVETTQENQGEYLRNITTESQVGWSEKNAKQRPSGPSSSSWRDSEIRVFLMEWEGVEQQVGHPAKMVHKKISALCQRLSQWGLKKSWTSCFYLLLSMQDLHRILCTERPRVEPLFSPYREALYRILGPHVQESPVPGPLCDGSGDPRHSTYCQTPWNQPWDYGVTVPSAELQGNPVPMMSEEDSLFSRWDPWNPDSPDQFHKYILSLCRKT
nr:uncharacterized protein LOC110564341 [Meriones unguiculatus]